MKKKDLRAECDTHLMYLRSAWFVETSGFFLLFFFACEMLGKTGSYVLKNESGKCMKFYFLFGEICT